MLGAAIDKSQVVDAGRVPGTLTDAVKVVNLSESETVQATLGSALLHDQMLTRDVESRTETDQFAMGYEIIEPVVAPIARPDPDAAGIKPFGAIEVGRRRP